MWCNMDQQNAKDWGCRAETRQPHCALFVLVSVALLVLAGCEDKSNPEKSATPPRASEVIETTSEKGAVKLTVRISPKEPRLSDLIQLDVIVTAPAEVKIKPPPFGKSVGEFLINDYNEKTLKTEKDSRTQQFHYVLEPQRTGRHLIRSIGVEFRAKGNESKADTIEAEPLDVNVTSPEEGQAADLGNLAPMNSPVELPWRLPPAWILALVAVGAGGLVAFIAYWRTRRGKQIAQVVYKSAEQIAKEALAALLAENLPQRGQFKEFYVRLTGIVRRYIEATTGLRAPEQTTEEFLRDMHFRKVFPPDRAEQLANFLEAADMVKYAGLQPGHRQIEEAIARAQEFVGLSSAFAPMPVKETSRQG
jgi:hypothetical protein